MGARAFDVRARHRHSRAARSAGHRQGDRAQVAPAARLQSPMPRRRRRQSRRRLLPLHAGRGLVVPHGDQLPGRRGDAVFGRLRPPASSPSPCWPSRRSPPMSPKPCWPGCLIVAAARCSTSSACAISVGASRYDAALLFAHGVSPGDRRRIRDSDRRGALDHLVCSARLQARSAQSWSSRRSASCARASQPIRPPRRADLRFRGRSVLRRGPDFERYFCRPPTRPRQEGIK